MDGHRIENGDDIGREDAEFAWLRHPHINNS
jgi:hypothetical protein